MVQTGIRNIFSNFRAASHKARGKKADRLRAKVKNTRRLTTGIRAGRLKAASARQKARAFLGVK